MMATHPSSVALAIPPWLNERLDVLIDKAYTGSDAQMRLVLDLAAENIRRDGGPFAAAIFAAAERGGPIYNG